jgi:DNA-binding winged helix-turn-helix (wHTH) protein/integrase
MAPRVVQFGVFQAYLDSGELYRDGIKLKLGGQPFQVLEYLLARPGEVVTREELRTALWQSDTFVDFDHGLNTAVNRIREVLGDSATNPRFVETVPRRGYRFIAPVGGPAEVQAEPQPEPPKPKPSRKWIPIAAGAATVALAAAIGLTIFRPRLPAPVDYKLTQITRDSGLTFQPSLSADGNFVVYASDRASGKDLYLPFYLGKWKESTAGTSANRIRHHIGKELGRERLVDLTLAKLQKFLERKAGSGLSYSVVDHLRWDLSSMFDMAVSEQVVSANPTAALYTPKSAKRNQGQSMSAEQVEIALDAVEEREKVILQLAVFAGMRPGELLAIQREQVSDDGSAIVVKHRVYRGKMASPKNGLIRKVAVGPSTASLLRQWMEDAVEPNPEAFVFAGETGQPLWRSSLLEDYIKAKLEPVGLGWVNFQVMRRTHASLGHEAKIDPKVSADQRGHGIGVAIDVYTKSSMKDRAAAAKRLEDAVFHRPAKLRKRSA